MATNRVHGHAHGLSVACSDPTTPVSGDPVRLGNAMGVAITGEGEGGNDATKTTVDFDTRVWDLSVKGVDDAGNSAVAVGDALFYVDGDSPVLSKKASGRFFGYALEAVTSGATATINVLLVPAPTVGALNQTSSVRTGFIPLDFGSAREISSNDIPATAADAGVLATDTTPAYERINGATDKGLRVLWAAGNVDAIQFAPVPLPPDLDGTKAMTVHFYGEMGGATDTPVITVAAFFNVGDTNAGGNTGALADAVGEVSVSLAAGDVPEHPGFLNIEITPGTHGTDTVILYAAWVEYTRR